MKQCIIENLNATIRRIYRNLKRGRDATMALRWTAAGMINATKRFTATLEQQAKAAYPAVMPAEHFSRSGGTSPEKVRVAA